jgi:hypothetical protein
MQGPQPLKNIFQNIPGTAFQPMVCVSSFFLSFVPCVSQVWRVAGRSYGHSCRSMDGSLRFTWNTRLCKAGLDSHFWPEAGLANGAKEVHAWLLSYTVTGTDIPVFMTTSRNIIKLVLEPAARQGKSICAIISGPSRFTIRHVGCAKGCQGRRRLAVLCSCGAWDLFVSCGYVDGFTHQHLGSYMLS